MTTTSKFKIGDKVILKLGLNENNTGLDEFTLQCFYAGNNEIIEFDNIGSYKVYNDVVNGSAYFSSDQLELAQDTNLNNQIIELIENKIQETLNKPYNVKIKYHDKNMPKFKQIEKGNWIDCRVIKGGKITHPDGTKEPLEWKIDENGTYYIEYKKGDFMMLPLGFSINQGKGYEINLVPRSSTFKNYGIIQTNHFAVGDDTFVGNNDMYHYPCYALRDGRINLYDRICQMRINKAMPQIIFNEVEDMESEDRGGFGTTGVK